MASIARSTLASLEVPGDWNSQLKELYLYEGTVWFGRNFPPKS
jgi:hypothetical protein